jgi:hypothetical protein
MKFTRETGTDVYGNTFARYASPRKTEIYLTKHGVSVDSVQYFFRSDEPDDMKDFISVLRAAEWHSKCLLHNGVLSTDSEPMCVEIVESETDGK